MTTLDFLKRTWRVILRSAVGDEESNVTKKRFFASLRMTDVLVTFALSMIIALLISVPSVLAQNYSFRVPELKMQVYVQPNGSARIVYDITFANDTFASPIDIVDIGTPTSSYSIGNMSASIDGEDLSDIRRSEFVDPGVEVHLRDKTIRAGESATLHFEFTMPDMVFQDTTRDDYASLRITPTWFDSQFVSGSTNVQIAIYTLPGIEPEELLFQNQPFTDKADLGDQAAAVWSYPNGSATGPNLVGVSFPQRGMTNVIRQTAFDILFKWFEENEDARIIAAVISLILLGVLFFRFSGGTGISVYVVLACGALALFVNYSAVHLISFIPLIGLIFLNESRLRRRRNTYLPAIAQVEGGGIKRGLTAPEAAVLLELPLNQILSLVIFGMMKKKILTAVRESPLIVEPAAPFAIPDTVPNSADAHAKYWRKVAQVEGVVLHNYEHPFLDVIEQQPGRQTNKLDLSKPMRELIKQAAARVKGFDLSDTQDYYRSIIQRALTEAQSTVDIQQKEEVLDRNFEWILLDRRYPTIFNTPTYTYRPIWSRGTIGRAFPSGSSSTSGGSSSSSGGAQTSLGDVGASFAGWAENTMGSLASAIGPGGVQVNAGRAGVLDLSGFDKVTGDIFKAMAESSSKGGGGRSGGGGGCACACAGCACACACAGGGR